MAFSPCRQYVMTGRFCLWHMHVPTVTPNRDPFAELPPACALWPEIASDSPVQQDEPRSHSVHMWVTVAEGCKTFCSFDFSGATPNAGVQCATHRPSAPLVSRFDSARRIAENTSAEGKAGGETCVCHHPDLDRGHQSRTYHPCIYTPRHGSELGRNPRGAPGSSLQTRRVCLCSQRSPLSNRRG